MREEQVDQCIRTALLRYAVCSCNWLGGRWDDVAENPHCRQLVHPRVNEDFHRVLLAIDPQREYQPRGNEAKSVIHWGQRKLLMSEIEFLTKFARPGHTVVYAGAAPGTHIEYLSVLFPDVRFVLVDPAPFTVRESARIQIIRDLFTDDLAARLASQHDRILFVSDIRTADYEMDPPHEVERAVLRDMQAQQQWHMIMRPDRSMLKFRLPWAPGVTEYLAGDIYLPVWGPVSTTECRLITGHRSTAIARYDNTKYEQQMYYFNNVVRPSLHYHDVTGEGLDHCYDCRAEIDILHAYLVRTTRIPVDQLPQAIARMSEEISRNISSDRTLAHPNVDSAERRRVIKQRQYRNGQPAYRR